MIRVAFSSSFRRAFRNRLKNQKQKEEKFWKALQIFIENPFDKRLRTHRLSGKLEDLWGFSVEYDIRIIFYFTENKNEAVFIDIGKHDEVY